LSEPRDGTIGPFRPGTSRNEPSRHYVATSAYFADRDQSFRSIVITRFGDRDRAERRWTLVSFAFSGPFVETPL